PAAAAAGVDRRLRRLCRFRSGQRPAGKEEAAGQAQAGCQEAGSKAEAELNTSLALDTARSLSHPNSGLPEFGQFNSGRSRIYPTSTGERVGVRGFQESR